MSSTQESIRAFTPEDCLDGASQGKAHGWAWDSSNPERRLAVEILIDGVYVSTVVAGNARQDLAAAGKGDGSCAFAASLPADACDGATHTLEAVIAGTDKPLTGSPMTIVLEELDPGVERTANGPAAGRNPRLVYRLPLEYAADVDDSDFTRAAAAGGEVSFAGMAVVIPTYNRSAQLETALAAWSRVRRPCEVEFIVVDDGSTDDTPATLERLAREIPGLRSTRVDNGGQGRARNHGVAMTAQPLVLFAGDDIRPNGLGFLEQHYRAHCRFPAREAGVLGKITWPDSPDDRANFVMSHVQGIGQQQFGYFHTLPYTWLDWRFFYTSNVSVKRDVVSDWMEQGFSTRFPVYGFEDAELAYRLSLQLDKGFRVLYCPAAAATHHHRFSVRQFIERQTRAGMMAAVFEQMHPGVALQLGTEFVRAALASSGKSSRGLAAEYLSVMEAIKSWAMILDDGHDLGSQNWHGDFLHAAFQVAFLQGRAMGHHDPGANHAAAYRAILRAFQDELSAAAMYEAFGLLLDPELIPY